MADYSFLTKKYPKCVTKDQFYRICHISKKTAKYYLDNGFIPCVVSKKKTRRYKIKIKDIIAFLEDREKNPEKYYLPNHYNNPSLPKEGNQYKSKSMPRNGKYLDSYKLKHINEVKDYQHYLDCQFTDYPDMMSTKQLRQVTGHSISVIVSWCKSGKVKFIQQNNTYFIQKKSVIGYLYSRELQE